MEDLKPKNLENLPKTDSYNINVKFDEKPDSEIKYSVLAALCPLCKEENTDVEEGENNCFWCEKKYIIEGYNEKKSYSVSG